MKLSEGREGIEGYVTSATSSIRLRASLKLGTVSSSGLVWEIGALS